MMTLIFGKEGEEFEIVELRGGSELVRRLYEMGIYPGVRVSIVSNSGFGPIILGINSTRIGLGRGMAAKIIVRSLRKR